MKLESLAIIFIIIILPIVIVLSEYIDNKINITELELEYDNRLLSSTYDAIKAYQLNTISNQFGDITNEKIRDIEAAVQVFYNSLTSSFNYTGYRAEVMKQYVPALVFTTYDGYYVYSPFKNTLTGIESGNYDETFSKDGEETNGMKPFVYYSCRYTYGNSDFTIIYTLDNYITIEGNINGQYVYDYGYLYSVANSVADSNNNKIYKKTTGDQSSYYYNGIEFKEDDTEELKEFVGTQEYSYVKINGKKYYLDETRYTDRGTENITEGGVTFKASSGIFFIDTDGSKNYSQTKGYSSSNTPQENNEFLQYYKAIKRNKSAYEYYKNAYEFSRAVLTSKSNLEYKDKAGNKVANNGCYNLSGLSSKNAYIWNNPASDTTSLQEYSGGTEGIDIFGGENSVQLSSSNFNEHRKMIIRYVVETNLSTAIKSFASTAGVSEFIMPKISDHDWEIIENDICAISFMQGMSMGAKKYNGYAVIANTLTNEYIDENDIYILTKDQTTNPETRLYCKANDGTIYQDEGKILTKGVELTYYPGAWKINFEKRKDVSTGIEPTYYIPMSYKRNGNQIGYLGSYTSIMGSYNINPISTSEGVNTDIYRYTSIDMYTYIQNTNNKLQKIYYFALGRERWGAYNVNNINYELHNNSNGCEYFLQSY